MASLEYDAFKLAEMFLKFYRGFTFKITSVKKTKWWGYFNKVAQQHSKEADWSPYAFIAAQFEKYGNILPYHLIKKEAYDAYIEYRSRFEVDNDKSLAIALLSSHNKIKDWSTKNGYKETNYNAFFNNENIINEIKRKLTKHDLYSIIKSFIMMNEKENIYTKEELFKSRTKIFTKKKILQKMKEVLGDEFN